MSTIFHKWDEVHNHKGKMYILVDNNYTAPLFGELGFCRTIRNFSEFNKNGHCDFVDNNSKNYMLYIAYRKENKPNWDQKLIAEHFVTHIFLKNKIYEFNDSFLVNNVWCDEIGNIISSQYDIWYDPFLFVFEDDLSQVIRYLKLKKINEIQL